MTDDRPIINHDSGARALIAEGLRHDAEMTKSPWEQGLAGNANTVHFDGDDITGVATVPRVSNVTGIVWLRNNARELLEGYTRALDEVDAKQRGYDDLHAMVAGSGDIWTKVDKLLQRMAADKNRSMSIESQAILAVERVTAERDTLRAENERLTADHDHWRETRRTTIEAGELLKAENDRLRSAVESISGLVRQAVADVLALNAASTATVAEIHVAGILLGKAVAYRVVEQIKAATVNPEPRK